MKKIGLVAVLSLLGAMMWTTGCGGGTPNCDALIADTQKCCDAASATTKPACDAAVSTYKASKTAFDALGTGDCAATTVDCTPYK